MSDLRAEPRLDPAFAIELTERERGALMQEADWAYMLDRFFTQVALMSDHPTPEFYVNEGWAGHGPEHHVKYRPATAEDFRAVGLVNAVALQAEWYRHSLHDATLRGEHAIPADELRSLVASFGRKLFAALSLEDALG